MSWRHRVEGRGVAQVYRWLSARGGSELCNGGLHRHGDWSCPEQAGTPEHACTGGLDSGDSRPVRPACTHRKRR